MSAAAFARCIGGGSRNEPSVPAHISEIMKESAMKIIVEAKVDIDAARRAEALDGARPWIEGAQAQAGCLGYFWTADPHHPARVHVFEEWESADALAMHLAGPQYRGMLDHISQFGITNAVSRKFAVEREGAVYNAAGVASAEFESSP